VETMIIKYKSKLSCVESRRATAFNPYPFNACTELI